MDNLIGIDLNNNEDIAEEEQEEEEADDFSPKRRVYTQASKPNEAKRVLDWKHLEQFADRKQKEWNQAEESRLGQFNPDLYIRLIKGADLGMQSSPTMSTNLGSNGNSSSLLRRKSANRRQQNVEELFAELDKAKKKGYIDLTRVMDKWDRFEAILKEQEAGRLKGFLQRSYEGQKITQAMFMKIMAFYINDSN